MKLRLWFLAIAPLNGLGVYINMPESPWMAIFSACLMGYCLGRYAA